MFQMITQVRKNNFTSSRPVLQQCSLDRCSFSGWGLLTPHTAVGSEQSNADISHFIGLLNSKTIHAGLPYFNL